MSWQPGYEHRDPTEEDLDRMNGTWEYHCERLASDLEDADRRADKGSVWLGRPAVQPEGRLIELFGEDRRPKGAAA